MLKKQKDMITRYNSSKKWDKYKKFMNDHELIFTSSPGFPNISKYVPISRSFFKMWEMLHDFKDELAMISDPNTILRSCSIAEGPGGFIEALTRYRREVIGAPQGRDAFYGMTLISSNKNVPNWKFTKEYMRSNNITLCYGKDGTGSLYKIQNILYLCDTIGRNTCDIVTGDGGFDYSSDFNEQEDASMSLLMCEVLAASMLQKPGGTFILKIFDISQPRMFQMMYFLHKLYDSINFVKPFTSRPANSEKYVVCIGFKGPNPNMQQKLHNAIMIENAVDLVRNFIHVPISFTKEIVYYNTHYSANQILSITKTLEFIDQCENHDQNIGASVVRHQLECALRWCYKYNMNISASSLSFYKKTYFS